MPWTAYAGMSDDDLRAVHAYLTSLPPRPTADKAPPRSVACSNR